MIRVYILPDDNFQILDNDLYESNAGATLISVFDRTDYPTEYQTLADNAHLLTWNGSDMQLNGETVIDAVWIAARATELSTEEEELSFVEAMRPIMKNWHKGIITTSQALAQAQTVLDNHTTHQTVMNSVIWPHTRLIVNDLANVTLANILGNANAEAAYLMALFNYATRVQAWRELA